jgi:phosphoribosylformylglycinamidine cyclo-ligase (EC 6.3.3.1)
MAPTRIYVKPLLQLIKNTGAVKAMAHITGGGLLDNIPRVLPKNAQAVVDVASWQRPAVFDFLQEKATSTSTKCTASELRRRHGHLRGPGSGRSCPERTARRR